MIGAIFVLYGGLVTWQAWRLLAPTLATKAFSRKNVAGRIVPTAGGLALVLTGLVLAAMQVAVAGPTVLTGATVTVILGFGGLGLLDDMAGEAVGSGGVRGFKGHVVALSGGQLTTGAVKLLGGGAVALVAAGLARSEAGVADSGLVVLLDASVIALAANLANLFDRAPGRSAKVGLLAAAGIGVAVAATGHGFDPLLPLLPLAGGLAYLVVPDVREELMLGDTGANVIGAGLGLAVVAVWGVVPTVMVAFALLALNLLSEVVSFSTVISRVPPLRAFDHLGRKP